MHCFTWLPFLGLTVCVAFQFRCIEKTCWIENLQLAYDGTFVFSHVSTDIRQLNVIAFTGDTLNLPELVSLPRLNWFLLYESHVPSVNLTLTSKRSTVEITNSTILRSLTFFNCRGLHRVIVQHSLLDSVPPTLYGQVSLQELTIQQSRIDALDFRMLASLPELKLLNLRNNRIKTIYICPETDRCPRLATLDLAGNLLKKFDFGKLALMTCLDYVSLWQNRLLSVENSWRGGPADAHLDNCSPYGNETRPGAPFERLARIDLGCNRLTEVNFSVFAPMYILDGLVLQQNALTHVHATEAQLPKQLAFLDLKFNRLAGADFRNIMSIRSVDIGANSRK